MIPERIFQRFERIKKNNPKLVLETNIPKCFEEIKRSSEMISE